MPVLDVRDVLSWPNGDNSTDTVISGVHFNLSALQHWNYTYYSNGTLSNGTNGWCALSFQPYTPDYVFANGSFTNMTSCFSPVSPVGLRGYIGIALAVLYGFALMFTLLLLTKHGRMYLPTEKRFRPVGRRWQWYWMIMMCATGFISLIVNIDVDRYYLPQIPIVITCFFWMLMNLTTMACVWEAVRHWGSWMERQYIDPDPFALAMDDKRAQFEFWVPLWFYLWWWLDFFLVIPRNWGNIELQRSVEQTWAIAAPSATDGRFKAAAFMLLVCWLSTAFYLRHSIKHYRERNRGIINRTIGLVRFTPYRFMLLIPISLFVVAFQALSAWEFEYGVFDVTGNRVSMFVGGYVPALLVLIIQIFAGFVNPNEDKELIRQRRERGAQNDRELGIVKRPAWWRRVNGEVRDSETMLERITRNVREVGGGQATATKIDRSIETRVQEAATTTPATDIEMAQMQTTGPKTTGVGAAGPPPATTYSGRSDRRRSENTMQAVAGLLFPSSDNPSALVDRVSYLSSDGPPPPYQGDSQQQQSRGRPHEGTAGNSADTRPSTAGRSHSANTSNTTNSLAAPPQQIKSMLDV